ncbi:MAG: hypothetical protein R2879_11440 [Saprospiraceae bacterium]
MRNFLIFLITITSILVSCENEKTGGIQDSTDVVKEDPKEQTLYESEMILEDKEMAVQFFTDSINFDRMYIRGMNTGKMVYTEMQICKKGSRKASIEAIELMPDETAVVKYKGRDCATTMVKKVGLAKLLH